MVCLSSKDLQAREAGGSGAPPASVSGCGAPLNVGLEVPFSVQGTSQKAAGGGPLGILFNRGKWILVFSLYGFWMFPSLESVSSVSK
jgi:hypothetical protein